MQTVTSPYPTEKRNTVYTLCGAKSGSSANKALQKMIASASLSTPSVAASGATTVWANGPVAPPQNHFQSIKQKQSTNGNRKWKTTYAQLTCARQMTPELCGNLSKGQMI